MRRGLAVLLAAGAISAACSSFSGGDDPSASIGSDAGTDATDATPQPEPEPEQDPVDAGSVDSAPPCANPTSDIAKLDTNAYISGGAPDMKRADISVCNMGSGRCLFRFVPTALAAFALQSKKAFRMTLLLTRADTSPECDSNTCGPLYRADGSLVGYPVNPDWDPKQVTWNHRRDNQPWNAPGAGGTDLGEQAGSVAVKASDGNASLVMDGTKWLPTFLAGNALAIRTSFVFDSTSAQFVTVFSAPGPPKATPYNIPSLKIDYCP